MVPAVKERFIHVEVCDPVQLMAFVPVFKRVKTCDAGEKGPPTGPLPVKPVPGETVRLSATVYDSTRPMVVELAGDVAPEPIPRLAKAIHKSARSAPPLSTTSA